MERFGGLVSRAAIRAAAAAGIAHGRLFLHIVFHHRLLIICAVIIDDFRLLCNDLVAEVGKIVDIGTAHIDILQITGEGIGSGREED